LDKLEILSISSSDITASVCYDIGQLKKLKKLSVTNSQIDEICLRDSLSVIPKLQSLDLSGCTLSQLILSKIAKLENLHEFTMTHSSAANFCLQLLRKFRYDNKVLLEEKYVEELKSYWMKTKYLFLRQKPFLSFLSS
jgi:Leucine-rich repeat (LRR) protein